MEHQNDENKLTIFIDSDAFVAMKRTDDANHDKAVRLFEQLQTQPVTFITSNYVFLEAVTVLSQKMSHNTAIEFINIIQAPVSAFSVKRITEDIDAEAVAIFKRQTSKNTSFVDCANMACIKRFKCDAIFSFDSVYRTNGITSVAEFLTE